MCNGKKVLDLWKINRSEAADKAAVTGLLKNSSYRVSGSDPFGNGAPLIFVIIFFLYI